MGYIAVKYIHFIGIMLMFSALVLEHRMIKPALPPADIQKILRVDAIFGISAMIVFITGTLLLLVFGKGKEFYTANIIFDIKVIIFLVVCALSLYSTTFFLKNRKSTAAQITLPKPAIPLLRLEIVLMLLIPLFAVMMAMGVGY